MIKKHLLFACLIVLTIAAKAQTKSPFFYELITNDDKSIDFVYGFYPSSYEYNDEATKPYTKIKSAVINDSKSSLEWDNYKVTILLKSGKLIRSYTTAATDGDFNCNYTVDGGDTHYQYLCFHYKFSSNDIDRVWLIMSDDKIFDLLYDKNKD